ncbi:MAG: RecQ family ATP-dependent DNA helicase [Sodaliphilus sp.]
MMTRALAEQRLQDIFGIARFYDEQWDAIRRLLKGERVLMIQRTGFGKSLCYQFPATQFPGITIIFSPLIALMRDQVNALRRKGIAAGYINSEQTPEMNEATIEAALQGKLKILYIAPERQENVAWQQAVLQMNISMVVIDEAHTISTWGHDFRPAFRRIIDLVKLLPEHCPVLATTATATRRVQRDIEQQIGGNLLTIRGSLARSNFHLYVVSVKSEEEKMVWLADRLPHMEGTGIVYVGTRVNTELYSKWLQYAGIDATEYNARFDADTRMAVEKGLMENRWKCIVSTNALGMGIDKPDIRFVIHTQIPVSLIHYYQEIGRAGRDGKPTTIILFYNESVDPISGKEVDMKLPISFIEGARPAEEKYRRIIRLLGSEPLSEKGMMLKSNLKQTQVRVIKSDLIEQKVIREVMDGKRKVYELVSLTAPERFDYSLFERVKALKYKELDAMVDYVHTDRPRMKYLCRCLDSEEDAPAGNCDNTNLPKLSPRSSLATEAKLQAFKERLFPELAVAEHVHKSVPVDGVKSSLSMKFLRPNLIEVKKNAVVVGREENICNFASVLSPEECALLADLEENWREKKSHITNGVAASYYGESIVGEAIHRCKYQNGGDFPLFLLTRTLKAYYNSFAGVKFDRVMYVPPTKSGDLVKNFAEKFAQAIGVPIHHGIIKKNATQEQKIFQNSASKRENVKDAFGVSTDVSGLNILLIDDVSDSGATLKEIGLMLTQNGAKWICPIVIAKTVGGTD